jgi:phosphoadenosine phosphosulfate reductase
MAAHDLPRHPLEAQGFASIGCAPCTLPPGPGGGLRDGRWAGSHKTECGIHWTHNGRPMRQQSAS